MTGATGTGMTGAATLASVGRASGAAAPAAGADACPLEIWDETAGVRVPDPRGFLQAMLGGISETAFENTVSIGQLRSATSRSMVHELKSYITNLSTTGDMSLDSAGALKLLRQQRSALEAKRVPEAAKSYAQLIGEIRNIEREIAQPEYENQLRKYQALRSEVRTEQVDRQTRREELLQKTAAQEAVLTQAGFDSGDDILDAKEHADMLYSLYQIGAALILALFALLILRGYWIALHQRDRFNFLTCAGISTLLAIQVFLNVAVVTNLVPCTGISLPFFSYGGTALLIQLGEMGIILSASRTILIEK